MNDVPGSPPPLTTWNDPEAIAEHRRMSAAECFLAAIALSRAALAFAAGGRDDH